ncbi:MAG: sensor domain-containing diguanylate cyclase, partial [Dehalococcoidia bacterium]|nr:sensor domain-containing diguanylate cyclase [Dehalococcoidia bacterium]
LFIRAHYGAETSMLGAIDALDLGEGFSGRVAQTGEPLFIPDVAKDTRLTRAAVLDEGFRSLASIPLISGGNVLGAMMMDAKEVRDFPPKMRRLLVSVGNEIGVAIERAQLLKRSQDRARELESLMSVTREIVSTLDLQEVLDRSLAIICRQVGAIQGFICLLEGENGELTPRTFFGNRVIRPGRIWKVGEGLVGWIAQHQKSIITDDLPSDPRIQGSQSSATGMRAALGAPLRVKDRLLGVVVTCSEEKAAFTEAHLRLVSAFAAEASMALENALLHEAVKRQASTDELTQLANRRYFCQRLEDETMRAGRYNRPLSLLFLDVDGLKNVNDRYGHAQGDLLLRHLADLMTRVTRGPDVAARLGGDEFVILLPETGREEAVSVAQRLLGDATSCPLVSGGRTIPWQVSIGVAWMPFKGNYEVDLLGMADEAVYRAKLQGTGWETATIEGTQTQLPLNEDPPQR